MLGGFRPSRVAALRSSMLCLEPLTHCSVSKPHKLIGSPGELPLNHTSLGLKKEGKMWFTPFLRRNFSNTLLSPPLPPSHSTHIHIHTCTCTRACTDIHTPTFTFPSFPLSLSLLPLPIPLPSQGSPITLPVCRGSVGLC